MKTVDLLLLATIFARLFFYKFTEPIKDVLFTNAELMSLQPLHSAAGID
jgi:hypothetical protein